jgi:hypothetical protein
MSAFEASPAAAGQKGRRLILTDAVEKVVRDYRRIMIPSR